jgi:hypothetical protein
MGKEHHFMYVSLLVILLDAAAIMFIVFLVNQGEQMDMMPAAICGFGISLGCAVCQGILGEALGVFAFAPMVLVAIGLIWVVAQIPLGRAAIAGVAFMVYKIALGFAFQALLSN